MIRGFTDFRSVLRGMRERAIRIPVNSKRTP